MRKTFFNFCSVLSPEHLFQLFDLISKLSNVRIITLSSFNASVIQFCGFLCFLLFYFFYEIPCLIIKKRDQSDETNTQVRACWHPK